MALPIEGRPAAEVLDELTASRAADMPTRGGVSWQYSYDAGRDELHDLAVSAFTAALETNVLDPTTFPSVVALENDVVGAVGQMLGGDGETAGTFTSGGTESIFLAVKAARDSRPDVERPTMVKPTTAHGAFHKAAHYLGLDIVNVPVDGETFKADPAAMAAAIDDSTVLVVASAVSYAHGVLDPVEAIAAAAAERGTLCHVDACVGGFLLPFLDEPVEPFDLSVPGVTSVSADVHKYGYAPKGASVVLFRDAELRHASYYCASEWTGYAVINAAVQSSRSAGPLAGAWAVLHHLGDGGYREIVRDARQATRRLIEGVEDIDGLTVLGDPIATLGAMKGDERTDVFVVFDELRRRGWYLLPQLSFDNSPVNLHFSAFGVSAGRVEELLAALAESVAAAQERGPAEPPEDLLAIVRNLDPDALTPEAFADLLARVELVDGEGVIRYAEINRLLDVATPAVRSTVLARYLGALYSPQVRAQSAAATKLA